MMEAIGINTHGALLARSGHDLPLDQRRAWTFVRFGMPLVVLVSLVDLGLGMAAHDPLRILAAMIPAIAAVTLLLAKKKIAVGRVREGVRDVGHAFVLLAAINALVYPDRYPAYEGVCVMAIMLALPHFRGHELQKFARFAVPFAIAIPLVCPWLQPSPMGSPLEHRLMTAGILIPVIGVSILLMVQFVERSSTTVESLETTRNALDDTKATLEARTSKLRAMLDTRRDAVVTCDSNGQTTYMNAPARKLLGLDAETTPRTLVTNLVQFEFRDADVSLVAMMQAARDGNHALTLPSATKLKTKSGELIPVEGVFTPLETGGVLAMDDMREKLRAESERVAKESAEAATRARSEFLANMSHEIRTPMNAVLGMSSLLAQSSLAEDQREFVETIRTSTAHLMSIINDILDFSKIDAGAIEFDRFEFDIRRSVEEAVALTNPLAAKKKLEMVVDIHPDVPQAVVGDAGRLRQILVNLLSNAVKFTAEGEVLFAVKTKAAVGDQVTVEFSVTDTGMGIPAEKLPLLFTPFGKVDASSARRHGGTGLGLVISKQLVEQMGGTMTVTSSPHKGSTFSFTIPLPAVTTLTPMLDASIAEFLRNKRVLIVDDHDSSRRLLAEWCSRHQLVPTTISDPREALEACRHERFDVALVDYVMPEMNGLQWTKHIVEEDRKLPVILLAPLGLQLEKGDSRLIASRLTKPLRETQLMEQIAAVLRGRALAMHRRPSSVITTFPKQRLRVLLVEDNLVNQRIAGLFLKKLGLSADVAGDGVEALEAVSKQRYDVIFMDVQMPRMDGLEASRRICDQYPPQNRPRIIALTAHAHAAAREECFRAGMSDFLSKPIEIEGMAAALQRAEAADHGRSAHP